MDFFAFTAVPFFVAMVISAFLFLVPMFGHLHFKHVKIQRVSIITAIISMPFVLFYSKSLERFVIDYGLKLLDVHLIFMGVFFLMNVIMGILMFRRIASIFQIIGLGLFLSGYFFLLA